MYGENGNSTVNFDEFYMKENSGISSLGERIQSDESGTGGDGA